MVFMSMCFEISLLELYLPFGIMILGKKFNFSLYFFKIGMLVYQPLWYIYLMVHYKDVMRIKGILCVKYLENVLAYIVLTS